MSWLSIFKRKKKGMGSEPAKTYFPPHESEIRLLIPKDSPFNITFEEAIKGNRILKMSKPGVDKTEFRINFYNLNIGEDYEVVDKPKFREDVNGGTWSYTLRPISERAKEFFGVKEKQTDNQ